MTEEYFKKYLNYKKLYFELKNESNQIKEGGATVTFGRKPSKKTNSDQNNEPLFIDIDISIVDQISDLENKVTAVKSATSEDDHMRVMINDYIDIFVLKHTYEFGNESKIFYQYSFNSDSPFKTDSEPETLVMYRLYRKQLPENLNQAEGVISTNVLSKGLFDKYIL